MNVEADVAAIKGVLESFAASCRDNDLERFMSLWAENSIQMPPNVPARVGKAKVTAAMRADFEATTLDLTILSIENAEVHGDLGVTRCVYKLNLVPKSGGATIAAVPQGKALTLYARQGDGTWKISYDCFNSDVAPE